MECPRCGRRQRDDDHFCAWCGRALVRDANPVANAGPKVTNLFLGIPTHAEDSAEPVLRVSRYVDDVRFETADGAVVVPGGHVRVSIWLVDRPVCAMSLTEAEADRLATFLLMPLGDGDTVGEPATS